MTSRHKLNGIRQDLLDMASKFRAAERLSFGKDTVAVCISSRHMDVIISVLEADAKSLREIEGGM